MARSSNRFRSLLACESVVVLSLYLLKKDLYRSLFFITGTSLCNTKIKSPLIIIPPSTHVDRLVRGESGESQTSLIPNGNAPFSSIIGIIDMKKVIISGF